MGKADIHAHVSEYNVQNKSQTIVETVCLISLLDTNELKQTQIIYADQVQALACGFGTGGGVHPEN